MCQKFLCFRDDWRWQKKKPRCSCYLASPSSLHLFQFSFFNFSGSHILHVPLAGFTIPDASFWRHVFFFFNCDPVYLVTAPNFSAAVPCCVIGSTTHLFLAAGLSEKVLHLLVARTLAAKHLPNKEVGLSVADSAVSLEPVLALGVKNLAANERHVAAYNPVWLPECSHLPIDCS